MTMKLILESWRRFSNLVEGGNKSPKTRDTVLNPELVKKAIAIYEQVMLDWGKWLTEQGKEPIKPLRPVGSVSYYEKDLTERPGTIYGDIDYLVEFPFSSDSGDDTSRRKRENAVKREYTQFFVDYLNSGNAHQNISVDETLLGNVLMVILELDQEVFIQADTVITFPQYSDWMNGRYTPQRGMKGYTMGRLFTAVGNYFPLSISVDGVVARTQDGKLVTGNVRKGVEIQTISSNPRTFLIDIAKYFAGENAVIDPRLQQSGGVDPDNISIKSLSSSIKALAATLEVANIVSANEMLTKIQELYKTGLQAQADDQMKWANRKFEEMKTDGSPDSDAQKYLQGEQATHQKLLKLNKQAMELFLAGMQE